MNEIVKKYFKEKILIEACSRYGIHPSNAKLIRSNSNLIYDCGDRILRLSHSEIRGYEDIEVEIDWMRFLQDNNLSIVAVINSKNNKEIERIGTSDHFSIVCFEKIIGEKIDEANWNELHFQNLGKLVGTLHKTGQKYMLKRNIPYKNWNEIDEYKRHVYLNKNHSLLYEKLVKEFNTYSKSEDNYGLIHYDIHHGNYLLSNDTKEIVLFDFEMVCKSWYISDIATVVYYAKHFPSSRNEEDFEKRFLESFWIGYEQEFKLDKTEKLKIPLFLLYRDLLVLGFVKSIWDSKNLKENQKNYIARIEQSILKRQFVVKNG